MLGFYSTKTAKVLFGDDLVHKLSNSLLAGGVAVFALSTLLALRIFEFNIDNAHPLARCLIGALMIVSATSIIINTGANIARNHSSPYSLLPLLITPTAFTIYGIDLILEAVLLEIFYSRIYAIGLLANCILCLYSLLIIRKNKRLIGFFLIFQFSLAITMLLLVHHDRELTISLVLWLSLLKFSLSLAIGSRRIQAEQISRTNGSKNGIVNADSLNDSCQTKKSSLKAKIFIWLPEKEMDNKNMTIPWIGKYFFAYSFQNKNIMVGHIAVSAEDFYASIYPDKEAFSQRPAKATVRQEIGHRHRVFHPGYWASFQHDLEKRGSDYAEIEIDIHDSEYLFKTWNAIKECTDYSLYRRNCAVISIHLYEACINQSLSALPFIKTLARVYFSTNFWSAVIAKQRSEMFLWTPGLAYDYINNLQQLITKIDR